MFDSQDNIFGTMPKKRKRGGGGGQRKMFEERAYKDVGLSRRSEYK